MDNNNQKEWEDSPAPWNNLPGLLVKISIGILVAVFICNMAIKIINKAKQKRMEGSTTTMRDGEDDNSATTENTDSGFDSDDDDGGGGGGGGGDRDGGVCHPKFSKDATIDIEV